MIVKAFDEFEPDSNLDEKKTEWQQALKNMLRRKPVTLRLQEQDISRPTRKIQNQKGLMKYHPSIRAGFLDRFVQDFPGK